MVVSHDKRSQCLTTISSRPSCLAASSSSLFVLAATAVSNASSFSHSEKVSADPPPAAPGSTTVMVEKPLRPTWMACTVSYLSPGRTKMKMNKD